MQLSIIIVTYNSAATIEGCLKSVFGNPPNFSFEVFVVDNASADGTVGVVKKFSQVKLVRNSQNLGFAKANNQAIKKSVGDYVFLLNPDTRVERGAISKMVEFMGENPDVGIVGPTVRVVGRAGVCGGGRVRPLLAIAGYLKFEEPPKRSLEVDYVTGSALLVRRKVIDEIGLIPEDYFFYYEETDWCLRAKKAGYRVVYYPAAKVLHEEGSSFKGRSFKQDYYGAKSGLVFGLRYTPFYLKPIFLAIVLVRFIKRLIVNGPSSPQFLGTLDFLRGRRGRSGYVEGLEG